MVEEAQPFGRLAGYRDAELSWVLLERCPLNSGVAEKLWRNSFSILDCVDLALLLTHHGRIGTALVERMSARASTDAKIYY